MGQRTHIQLERTFYSWRSDDKEDFARFFGDARTWDDLLQHRRVVVLAEGGSGKSSELKERARLLRESGRFAVCASVEEVGRDGLDAALATADQDRLRDWLASEDKGWFFIDSIDEAKRNDVKFQTAVRKLAKGIPGAVGRAHIVISGRHHDWDSAADIQSLMDELPVPEAVDEEDGSSTESPSKQLANNIRQRNKKKKPPESAVVVVLSPLDEEQIARYASGIGVSSPQPFIDALRDQGLIGFAARPLDLEWLATYWNQNRRVASLREMIESSLRQRLRESKARKPDGLDEVVAFKGLERIGAALVFGQKETISIPGSKTDSDPDKVGIDLADVLPDWSAEQCGSLLSRAVFEPAGSGRTRLHNDNNGVVRAYLTARWLHRLLDKNLAQQRLHALLFVTTYGLDLVRPALRDAAVWLAAENEPVAKELIRREPLLLLDRADSGSLPLQLREAALTAVAEALAAKPEGRAPIPNYEAFKRFARADLAAKVKALWKRFDNVKNVKQILLHLIYLGALPGCSEIAEEAAFSQADDDLSKVISGRALLAAGSDSGMRRYAALIKDDPVEFDKYIFWEAIEALFPRWLSVDEVLAIFRKLQACESPILDQLDVQGPKFVKKLFSQAHLEQFLQVLLDGLGGRSGRLAHLQNERESRYFRAVQATGQAILNIAGPDVASDLVIDAALRLAERHDRHARNRPDDRSITSQLHKSKGRRRLAFWRAAAQFKDHPDFQGRDVEQPWAMDMLGYTAGLKIEDLDWLLVDGPRGDSAREKRLAVNATLEIWRSGGGSSDIQKRIEAAFQHDVTTAAAYRAGTEPHKSSADLLEMEEKYREQTEHGRKEAAARDQSWEVFFDSIRTDPAQLDVLNPTTDKGVDQRLFNLWTALWESNASGNTYGINSLGDFGILLGEDVSRRFLSRMYSHWRQWRPQLESERPVGSRNQVRSLDIMGVAGVALESAADADWAKRLSPKDAVRAAQYATIEINGLPNWLTSLAMTHPESVRTGMLGEIEAEIDSVGTRDRCNLLSNLARAPTDVASAMVPALLKVLRTNDTLPSFALRPLLDTIVAGLGDAKERKALGRIATRRIQSNDDPAIGGLYLSVLFDIDPEAATKGLIAKLDALDGPEKKTAWAQQVMPDLFGDGFGFNRRRRADLPFESLTALVQIAFETIRMSEDRRRANGKVFSPDQRDLAEEARGAAFRLLVDTPGQATFETLMRLATTGLLSLPRDHLERLALQRAYADSELDAWPLSEPYAFERDCEAQPQTTKSLQRLALDRFADLQGELLHGDFAQGGSLKLLPNETAVQNWVADRLRLKQGRAYSVERESHVAEEKEPDVRLRAKGESEASLPIEIKIAESWSVPQLVHALRIQLCKQYLRAPDAKHGVLLLVHKRQRVRGWKNPETHSMMRSLSELIEYLTPIASEICASAPDAAQPEIAVLDVSTCPDLASDERKGSSDAAL